MQHRVVHNLSRPAVPPVQARYCASFFCRLRGLTFRRSLPPEAGLLLVQERESRVDAAIHMFFVWIALAVVWITNAGEVVDVRLARPWHPLYLPKRAARYVLELPAARLADFRIGEWVRFDEK